MTPEDFKKLGTLFALQAELQTIAMPQPGGMLARRRDNPGVSDFQRCDFTETPVRLFAVRCGTTMNAFFNSTSLEGKDKIIIDELRLTLEEVEKVSTMLRSLNTPIARWNSVMMRAAMAFAKLPDPKNGVPDVVVEDFVKGAGIAPIVLAPARN
ncbi:MAG TPA: hypothetical protein PLF01_02210 [Alphaproteobacteria bacterium]|nr:hypothetical protein [Alphaproteobacteria bacterium]